MSTRLFEDLTMSEGSPLPISGTGCLQGSVGARILDAEPQHDHLRRWPSCKSILYIILYYIILYYIVFYIICYMLYIIYYMLCIRYILYMIYDVLYIICYILYNHILYIYIYIILYCIILYYIILRNLLMLAGAALRGSKLPSKRRRRAHGRTRRCRCMHRLMRNSTTRLSLSSLPSRLRVKLCNLFTCDKNQEHRWQGCRVYRAFGRAAHHGAQTACAADKWDEG